MMEDQKVTAASQLAGITTSIRDVVVSVGATIYILGLLVWSIYGLSLNIAIGKVFDLQYFVAGIIPGTSILLTILVWLYANNISNTSNTIFSLIGMVPLLLIGFDKSVNDPNMDVLFGSAILMDSASIYLCVTTPSLFVLLFKNDSYFSTSLIGCFDKLTSFVPIFFSAAAFITFLIVYSLTIYPRLPQALGGARPRCAVVNVEEDKVKGLFYSSDRAHFPESMDGQVTIYLIVLYASDDLIYLRPRLAPPLQSAFTYEISRDAFDSIAWCSEVPWTVQEENYWKKNVPEVG